MQTTKHDSIWKTSLQRLRQDWGQVFTTHLAYTALGIILFTPLVALMGRLFLSLSDQPALADQDIAWFLLSSAGIAAIVLLAGLTIAILGVEQASLMTMGAGRAQGLSISTVAALRYTAAHAHSIFAFAVRLVVRVLLLTLPFLAAAGAIALFLLTDYDINYYLSEQPVELWIAAVMIGLLLLAMALILVSKLFAWSMALPLVLFAGIPPAKSFAASERFTAGHKRKLIKVLAIWALLALILGAVVLGVIQQLGSWDATTEESFAARKQADLALLDCVVETGTTRTAELSREYDVSPQTVHTLYATIAGLMYRAVRMGGVPCSGLPWRWGYGWPACD